MEEGGLNVSENTVFAVLNLSETHNLNVKLFTDNSNEVSAMLPDDY